MNKIYTVKRNRYLLRTSMINLNKKKTNSLTRESGTLTIGGTAIFSINNQFLNLSYML